MKRRFLVRSWLLAIMALFATTAHATDATTESERAILIRIAAELEYLQSLATKAQASADQGARVQFDYPAFFNDLKEIQSSVERHAAQPQRTPRQIAPLKKRYSK